jgi:hypothetical protein
VGNCFGGKQELLQADRARKGFERTVRAIASNLLQVYLLRPGNTMCASLVYSKRPNRLAHALRIGRAKVTDGAPHTDVNCSLPHELRGRRLVAACIEIEL